jgi:hypothetical protein
MKRIPLLEEIVISGLYSPREAYGIGKDATMDDMKKLDEEKGGSFYSEIIQVIEFAEEKLKTKDLIYINTGDDEYTEELEEKMTGILSDTKNIETKEVSYMQVHHNVGSSLEEYIEVENDYPFYIVKKEALNEIMKTNENTPKNFVKSRSQMKVHEEFEYPMPVEYDDDPDDIDEKHQKYVSVFNDFKEIKKVTVDDTFRDDHLPAFDLTLKTDAGELKVSIAWLSDEGVKIVNQAEGNNKEALVDLFDMIKEG